MYAHINNNKKKKKPVVWITASTIVKAAAALEKKIKLHLFEVKLLQKGIGQVFISLYTVYDCVWQIKILNLIT